MQANTLRGKKLAAPRVHPLFHVLRGREPDLSAPPWCASRGKPLARLCGVRRQRHRSAHHGRCRRGRRGRAGSAGQPGPPEVCPRLCDFGLSLHRALPRHPPHGQHLVRDAGAAGWAAGAALQLGLLPPVFFAAAFLVALRARRSSPTGWAKSSAPPCIALILLLFRGRAAPPGQPHGYGTPDRRLRSALPAVQGILGRLPDHGHSGRAEFRGGHCAEHPGPRHRPSPGSRPSGAPSGPAFLAAGLSAGRLRHAHPHRRH